MVTPTSTPNAPSLPFMISLTLGPVAVAGGGIAAIAAAAVAGGLFSLIHAFVTVTLRADQMWRFMDRLVSVAIPRIRDFRGLSPKGFDGRGNYSFGVDEQLIFPEIDYDDVSTTRGMDITIVTTAETNEGGRALLDAFGFPFRKTAAQV